MPNRPPPRLFGSSSPDRSPRKGLARWVGDRLAQLSYAVLVEPTWLEVNRLRFALREGTESPFRVVQISDIHYHGRTPLAYMLHCVQSANAENADIIALTGDYIHAGGRHVDKVAEILGKLRAKSGVFAVLGNHDHAIRASWGLKFHRHLNVRVAQALTKQGIRVLHNELVVVEHEGQKFQISGVDDLWSRKCLPEVALAQLDPALPHIMLAHHPLTIHLIEGKRCDLMLSGHTHGGQIHSERFGSITLSNKMKQYAAGLYTFGNQRLYVNKGVGYGWRIRYNRRPEIAVFEFAGVPAGPANTSQNAPVETSGGT
ncbi:MAG: metallophosphoesterase [Planctomycetota bacterium]|nr:metallophosphoesterase [Planctomycetota bacterium]